MSHAYSDLQLDALREVANIGSGTAGTALSGMLGRSVDLAVPRVLALPLNEAVEAIGAPESPVTAVVLPIFGDLDGVVMLLFTPEAVGTLCALLGVEPDSEVGQSALGEIGNILGASYVRSLGDMTGLKIEPRPPQAIADMLGAVVSSVLMHVAGAGELVLVMDSELEVEQEACALSFLLVPDEAGVTLLLERLGLGTS